MPADRAPARPRERSRVRHRATGGDRVDLDLDGKIRPVTGAAGDPKSARPALALVDRSA